MSIPWFKGHPRRRKGSHDPGQQEGRGIQAELRREEGWKKSDPGMEKKLERVQCQVRLKHFPLSFELVHLWQVIKNNLQDLDYRKFKTRVACYRFQLEIK